MVTIPEEYRDLFEKPSFAFVATLLPDGAPHVVPTWVGLDGDDLLVNTVRGSRKDRNLRKDPRIALAIADPENPHRYLAIRGEAIDIREEGARKQLDVMAERYTGDAKYPGPEGDRVLITVRPDATSGQSPPPRRL
jgi:PPOX class probable F420-dependent enzyme